MKKSAPIRKLNYLEASIYSRSNAGGDQDVLAGIDYFTSPKILGVIAIDHKHSSAVQILDIVGIPKIKSKSLVSWSHESMSLVHPTKSINSDICCIVCVEPEESEYHDIPDMLRKQAE